MRVDIRRPRQPVTWIPDVLDLFKQKGLVTSKELAVVMRMASGGDAVTRCRQVGLPIEAVGFAPDSRIPKKLYGLDAALLWSALEEALKQMNGHALLLNPRRARARSRISAVTAWMAYLRKSGTERSKKRHPLEV